MDINFSIRGKKCVGRWYNKKKNQKEPTFAVFVNKIAESYNPEERPEDFIAEINATVMHEIIHIIGFRNGCKPARNCPKKCFLCRFTIALAAWHVSSEWNPQMSEFSKQGTIDGKLI